METAFIAGLEQRFGAQPGSATRVSDSVFEPQQDRQAAPLPPRKPADKAWTDMVPAAKPQSPRPLQRGESRSLTPGEIEMARTVFGDTIKYDTVLINRFSYSERIPDKYVVAPDDSIYFNPDSSSYSDDFSKENISLKGLFIHEMTHILQHQHDIWLKTRIIFNSTGRIYDYEILPNKPFSEYGLEQQGNIVRDYFFLKNGIIPTGNPGKIEQFEALLPFKP